MSLVSPLERRERARKRKDLKRTAPAQTKENMYLDSVCSLLLTKMQESKRPTFVNNMAPGGQLERTSWVKPKSTAESKPSRGERKNVPYTMKGTPMSGLTNSTGRKEKERGLT